MAAVRISPAVRRGYDACDIHLKPVLLSVPPLVRTQSITTYITENNSLFTHHAVGVPHILVGRVSPVDRRYTVGPGLRAGDPSITVVVIPGESVHVAGWGGRCGAAPGSRIINSVDAQPVRTWSMASASTWMRAPPSKCRVNRFRKPPQLHLRVISELASDSLRVCQRVEPGWVPPGKGPAIQVAVWPSGKRGNWGVVLRVILSSDARLYRSGLP